MIEISGAIVDIRVFPAGEPHARVLSFSREDHKVNVEFTRSREASLMCQDIMVLTLVSDAIIRAGGILDTLTFDYLPFGRQDRVATEGDSFSLMAFANNINMLGWKKIVLIDPHSPVAESIFNNVTVIPQWELASLALERYVTPYWLVSPDKGAEHKIKRLHNTFPYDKGIIFCSKSRNPDTGELSSPNIEYLDPDKTPKDAAFVIVDDICDGGGTFIALADRLWATYSPTRIDLIVSHGIFSKGLSVFDGYIEHIYVRGTRIK